jgi:hypothetical protein
MAPLLASGEEHRIIGDPGIHADLSLTADSSAGHGEDPFANRVTKWSNRYSIHTLGARLNHLSIFFRSPKYPERGLFAKP